MQKTTKNKKPSDFKNEFLFADFNKNKNLTKVYNKVADKI